MIQLSNMCDRLIGQPMFELLKKARSIENKGNRVIHYEIGDPNYNSPKNVIDAAKKALDENKTHYTNSAGLPELREAVRDYVYSFNGFKPLTEQIVICPANAIIDFVCRCVANIGDDIIYPNPGFPTYYSSILYNGFNPVPVYITEKNNFRMNPSDVEKAITNKTKLIIMNSCQNPTGSVMSEEEIRHMEEISEKYNIFLLSDEVYSRITYGSKFYSPSKKDNCLDRTIILQSLSKTFSMSGWRLGFVIAPEHLSIKISLLLQTILSCLPPFTQFAAIEALNGDQTDFNNRVVELKDRRDILINGLNSLKGVSCLQPEGSFYAFPNITGTGMTCQEYSDSLLEKTGVCVLPGNCFGDGGEGYVRLCYASTNIYEIIESIDKMKEFHKNI